MIIDNNAVCAVLTAEMTIDPLRLAYHEVVARGSSCRPCIDMHFPAEWLLQKELN